MMADRRGRRMKTTIRATNKPDARPAGPDTNKNTENTR